MTRPLASALLGLLLLGGCTSLGDEPRPVAAGMPTSELLPLKHGLYVLSDRPCEPRGDADTVSYYGPGLGFAQTISIEALLSKHDNVYTLNRELSELADLDAPPVVGEEVVTVLSPTSFHYAGQYGAFTYRWCAESGAP